MSLLIKPTRRAVAVIGSAVLALGLMNACSSEGQTTTPAAGSAGSAAGSASGGTAGSGEESGATSAEAVTEGKIAFLMPDLASTRYEQQDSPLFTAKVGELCPGCEVIYQNADSDPSKQQAQADSAIAQGVKVIVLDAVDTKAAASIVTNAQSQGIPVITYDRPITTTPADYYISFDNEGIGKLISESLVTELAGQGTTGGVLIVGGSPTDDAAGLIKKGMEAGVATSDYQVLAAYDTPEWDPQKAQDWVAGQITQFGDQIAGVVAANDGTGGGSIAALKAAGVTPLPLVTGNDAEIAAIQRIIAGDQYNTISKPIKIVAEAAAETAIAFLSGQPPAGEVTLFETPSRLFTPEVVTQENVKEVIFDGGIYTAEQVCTAEYAAACTTLSIAA